MLRLMSGVISGVLSWIMSLGRLLRGRDQGRKREQGVFRHAVVMDRTPHEKGWWGMRFYTKDDRGRLSTPHVQRPVKRPVRQIVAVPMFDSLDGPAEDIIGFHTLAIAVALIDPDTGAPFNAQITTDGPLNSDALRAAFAEVEKHGLRVARVFMSYREYLEIRKFSNVRSHSARTSSSDAHVWATLWGAEVIMSRRMLEGTVYVCADREYLGVMPEASGGVIGIGIHNPKGVASVTVRRNATKGGLSGAPAAKV